MSVMLALQAPEIGSPILVEALRHPAAAQIDLLAVLVDVLAAARAEPTDRLRISDGLRGGWPGGCCEQQRDGRE